jgi:hypothetical protein
MAKQNTSIIFPHIPRGLKVGLIERVANNFEF